MDLANFTIIRQLGSGAFGTTYLCKNAQGDRFVLKRLNSQASAEPKAIEMFKAECDRLRQVGDHPQIPEFYGLLEEEGTLAIAQEYIPGQTFQDILNMSGPISVEDTLTYLELLLEPLAYMHRRRLMHRDIKPEKGAALLR
jgi:serine/threonine protein kinase